MPAKGLSVRVRDTRADQFKVMCVGAFLNLPPWVMHGLLSMGMKQRFLQAVRTYNRQPSEAAMRAVLGCLLEAVVRLVGVFLLIHLVFKQIMMS